MGLRSKLQTLRTISSGYDVQSSLKQGLSWEVHSAGVAEVSLPRIVLSPRLTSIRTINKGGSTRLRSHIEHTQTKGDLDIDAEQGANQMAKGTRHEQPRQIDPPS